MENLPEEMIHHVQSFLRGKEAVRTSILSKSWHSACLTCPNLDFVESSSPTTSSFQKFAETIQRYDQVNRNIQSFRLRMYISSIDEDSYKISLANELIAKAMKLGATDLSIEVTERWDNYVVPDEVLQSESLLNLSLIGGSEIILHDKKLVSCSRLKSLNLGGVRIEGNNLWDIISTCPSIEELVLFDCNDNTGISVLRSGSCVDDFHKLKVLSLENVRIGEQFFHSISRFPCLKELTLQDCYGYGYGYSYKKVQICSNSVECISFSHASMLKAEFDVPKIRKFKFSSCCLPSFSFKATPKEWKFDMSIGHTGNFYLLQTSWLQQMTEFLFKLSPSEISLHLNTFVEEVNVEFFENDVIVRRHLPSWTTLLEASVNSRKIDAFLQLKRDESF